LWSAEPFAPWFSADIAGAVKLKAARARFTPTLVVQQAQTLLRFGPSEFAIEDLSGTLAGGHLASELSIHRTDHGLAARIRVGLTDADATAFITGRDRPPISGRLALQIDGEAEGLSPIALIGSVTGGGTITLDGGALTGLGPQAFATLTRAVDQGTMLDAPRIRDIVSASLESGRFDVRHLDAAITLTLGQAHVGATVKHEDADLTVNADLDLSQARLDARLTLSGAGEANASELRPDVLITLKGPIASPQRALDVSSLASWLTLRAVERQTQRLEVIEASRREPSSNDPRARTSPPGPAREEAAPAVPEPGQAPGGTQQPAAPSALLPQAPEPPPKTIETSPLPLPSERKPSRPPGRPGLRSPSPASAPAATSRPRPKRLPPRLLPFNLLGRP
jgi:large subunit ribosomal protein L24